MKTAPLGKPTAAPSTNSAETSQTNPAPSGQTESAGTPTAPPPVESVPMTQEAIDRLVEERMARIAELNKEAEKAKAPAAGVSASAPASIPMAGPPANWIYVLDTTAINEPRSHDYKLNGAVLSKTFKPRTPELMAPEIAVKFLKHSAFIRTDADGNPMPFQQTPKQPHELEAGQKLELTDDQTIAALDELHTPALQMRCMQIEGGEIFAGSRHRDQMVAFLTEHNRTRKLKNMGRDAMDMGGLESFTPEPEADSALMGSDAW